MSWFKRSKPEKWEAPPIWWRYQYAKHFMTLAWLLRVNVDPDLVKDWAVYSVVTNGSALEQAHKDMRIYMRWY